MKKKIGIIGGMGPLATVDLFAKIIKHTEARNDQEHIRVIIDNHPQIPDRTAAIFSNGENPVPYIAESACILERAGADALVMPCNTAHYFLNDVKSKVSIPFISIVDSAVNAVKSHGSVKNVAVVSTTGTRKTGIYEKKLTEAGYNVLDIPDDIQQKIMYCIYDGVKSGKTEEVVSDFQYVINELEKSGAELIIAACTEIPILLPYVKVSIPVVDATLELAKAAVEFASN